MTKFGNTKKYFMAFSLFDVVWLVQWECVQSENSKQFQVLTTKTDRTKKKKKKKKKGIFYQLYFFTEPAAAQIETHCVC